MHEMQTIISIRYRCVCHPVTRLNSGSLREGHSVQPLVIIPPQPLGLLLIATLNPKAWLPDITNLRILAAACTNLSCRRLVWWSTDPDNLPFFIISGTVLRPIKSVLGDNIFSCW